MRHTTQGVRRLVPLSSSLDIWCDLLVVCFRDAHIRATNQHRIAVGHANAAGDNELPPREHRLSLCRQQIQHYVS
jgi:hypothetical protein